MVLPHQYVDQEGRFAKAAAAAAPAEAEEPECMWEAHARLIDGRQEGGGNARENDITELKHSDKNLGKRFCTAMTHESLSSCYQGKHPTFERLLVPPVTVAEGESRNIGCLVSSSCLYGSHGCSVFV